MHPCSTPAGWYLQYFSMNFPRERVTVAISLSIHSDRATHCSLLQCTLSTERRIAVSKIYTPWYLQGDTLQYYSTYTPIGWHIVVLLKIHSYMLTHCSITQNTPLCVDALQYYSTYTYIGWHIAVLLNTYPYRLAHCSITQPVPLWVNTVTQHTLLFTGWCIAVLLNIHSYRLTHCSISQHTPHSGWHTAVFLNIQAYALP